MKCERCEALLWEKWQGELSNEDKKAVEAHLMNCPTCQKTNETLRKITLGMQNLKDVPMPESFHHDLMHTIREQKLKETRGCISKRKTPFKAWYGVGIAAVCCGIFIGIGHDYIIRHLTSSIEMASESSCESEGSKEYIEKEETSKLPLETASETKKQNAADKKVEKEAASIQAQDENRMAAKTTKDDRDKEPQIAESKKDDKTFNQEAETLNKQLADQVEEAEYNLEKAQKSQGSKENIKEQKEVQQASNASNESTVCLKESPQKSAYEEEIDVGANIPIDEVAAANAAEEAGIWKIYIKDESAFLTAFAEYAQNCKISYRYKQQSDYSVISIENLEDVNGFKVFLKSQGADLEPSSDEGGKIDIWLNSKNK